MKPRSAKNKGKRLQETVAQKIRETFNLEERAVVSTPNSINGADLLLSEQAKELFPYSTELKNCEKLSIWAALKQAEYNVLPLTKPLLVFSRNRSKIYACLELDDLLYLLKTIAFHHGLVEK